MMNEKTKQQIVRFVRRDMSPEERVAFSKRMANDEQLAREVALYEETVRAVHHRKVRGSGISMEALREELEAFKQTLPPLPNHDESE